MLLIRLLEECVLLVVKIQLCIPLIGIPKGKH